MRVSGMKIGHILISILFHTCCRLCNNKQHWNVDFLVFSSPDSKLDEMCWQKQFTYCTSFIPACTQGLQFLWSRSFCSTPLNKTKQTVLSYWLHLHKAHFFKALSRVSLSLSLMPFRPCTMENNLDAPKICISAFSGLWRYIYCFVDILEPIWYGATGIGPFQSIAFEP